MARIRTIKPEFFTSEDIVELDPIARLLYIALWCEADKEGRFAWKPKTFKIRYLPADDCEIDALCDALVMRGLVVLYGDNLAYIPKFKDHQHINPREKDSTFPDPSLEKQSEITTREPRVSDASVTVNTRAGRKEGREGKDIHASDKSDTFTASLPKDLLSDFLKVRKAKKAGPLTETAFNGIVSEAGKAGITVDEAVRICCVKSWVSFNSTWDWKSVADLSKVESKVKTNADGLPDYIRPDGTVDQTKFEHVMGWA